MVLRLVDFCAHDGIGFAIADDEELIVTNNLVAVCIVGSNSFYRSQRFGGKLTSV